MEVIRIDFQGRRRSGQGCLFERFDNERSHQVEPGRYVDLRFLRVVLKAQEEKALPGPAIDLALSFAKFLREDRDGRLFAYPSRKAILAGTSFSSMTTYKRYWPQVLEYFQIRTERRRGRRGNVYVWQPAPAQQEEPRQELDHEDLGAGAIAAALWAVPEARQVLESLGASTQYELELRLARWLTTASARIAREWPWVYVAHLEAKYASGLGNPFERTSTALTYRTSQDAPEAARVRELESAFKVGQQESTG